MKVLMTRHVGGVLGRSGSGMINRRCGFNEVVQSRRHMATTVTSPTELESSGHAPVRVPAPAPAAAGDTRWMLLNRWGCWTCNTMDVPDVFPDDDKTAAEFRTTWGRPLRVSLSRVTLPAISHVCFNHDRPSSEDVDDDDKLSAYDDALDVVAAHGDSVLLKMSVPCWLRPRLGIGILDAANDYFQYMAAAATGQPPSLSLLPACHIPMYGREFDDEDPFQMERVFDMKDTSLLHYGGELCVLRPGARDWELKEAVPILHNNTVGEGRHDLGEWQELNATVPVGNRFLCWVNYDRRTFLVCDMADQEKPKLRYVLLPMPPMEEWDDEHVEPLPWQDYWNIGAAPGAGVPAVRFVTINNLTKGLCERSSSGFVVTTWTMALMSTGEPMEWVKEGVLHSEELWAAVLAASYEDIPRVCELPHLELGEPQRRLLHGRGQRLGDERKHKVMDA